MDEEAEGTESLPSALERFQLVAAVGPFYTKNGSSSDLLFCDPYRVGNGSCEKLLKVYHNIPALLHQVYGKNEKRLLVVGSGGEPYPVIEERLGVTRKILVTALNYGINLVLITHSRGVLKDLYLLKRLAQKNLLRVETASSGPGRRRIAFDLSRTLLSEGIPTKIL